MQTIKFSGEFFNVEDTLQCGQTFRFKKYLEGYLVISQDKICYAYNKDGFAYIETEYPDYFINYFDLSTDYSKIVSTAYSFNIPILTSAVNYGKGIRILRQSCEEMLYHFTISQNNNIPRIKNTIEKISQKFGKKISSPFGEYYAFPTSKELSILSKDDLIDVGLGYRLPYILEIAPRIVNGLDLYAFNSLTETDLYNNLIKIKGVGDKVANCIILFGYHKTKSFPVDTWIEKLYLEDFNGTLTSRLKMTSYFIDLFKEYSGYIQQYLFYYKRKDI